MIQNHLSSKATAASIGNGTFLLTTGLYATADGLSPHAVPCRTALSSLTFSPITKPITTRRSTGFTTFWNTSSVKTIDRDWTSYTVVGLTLRLISPAWVKEETVAVLPVSGAGVSSDKKYMGKYPYKYSEGGNVTRFFNDTPSSAPMIIKIFGACSNPSVYVGGNEYSVNTSVAAGEYVVIDQRDKSICRVGQNGARSNIFNLRKKSVDNFKSAPSGSLTVTCSGQFACEVTFLTQRSEPEWT